MERLLLRPAEAAELLGVGRSKVYALLVAGEVPSIRVGRSVRVPVDALKRWVAARADAGSPGIELSRQDC